MAERLYRKVALERQSSPEQLDTLMQVTSPAGWISLLTAGALLACVAVWSCLGSIPVKVTGRGVLLSPGGVYEIVSGGAGTVKDLYVEPGDVIVEGSTVALVDQPGLLGRLREATDSLEILRAERERLSAEPGLSAKLRAVEDDILAAERSLRLLRDEYDASSRVTSPFTGKVLELVTRTGDLVTMGTPLLVMEPSEDETGAIRAVMYFPSGAGEKIRRGMEAQIVPMVVERAEYGFLKGSVTRVADFPSSRQGMMRTLRNEALVETLSRDGAPLEVLADLIPDSETPSGFAWSSPHGPDIALRTGMLCTTSVTVAKRRPISLLVPFLKKRFLGIG